MVGKGVNPARAGMIRAGGAAGGPSRGKPRTRGDDPFWLRSRTVVAM